MKNVICFVLGATAGSLITWKLVEKRYKNLADEEINAVRELYRQKLDELNGKPNVEEAVEPVQNEEKSFTDRFREEYKQQVKDLGYDREDDDYTIHVEQGEERIEPYVIDPNEYGDKPGYDTSCWTHYADGIVTDENDDIVHNPEAILGDALKHYGDYDDGSVYVRNDNTKCDYEILKHDRTYSEIMG